MTSSMPSPRPFPEPPRIGDSGLSFPREGRDRARIEPPRGGPWSSALPPRAQVLRRRGDEQTAEERPRRRAGAEVLLEDDVRAGGRFPDIFPDRFPAPVRFRTVLPPTF